MENIQKEPKQIQSQQYSPLRLIGILTLIGFCTILIIVATFTRIKVFNCLQPLIAVMHPENFPNIQSVFAFKAYYYIPQIPIILFASTLLGGACSMLSVFFYIIIGLAIIPVFGLGGGFDYVLEPTFGYILAFLPACMLAASLTDKEYSFKSMLKSAFAAVLLIHILGFFYMLLVAFIKHEDFVYIMDWLTYESFIRAIYDFIFGLLFMFIAKFLRKFIWILTTI